MILTPQPQAPVLTVTLNPALDLSTSTDEVVPELKLRCEAPDIDPGGGGINVSRAIANMGGRSRALVALGGATGTRLCDLLHQTGLPVLRLNAPGETRQSLSVIDRSDGAQFRFVLPGPEWRPSDVRGALCWAATDNWEWTSGFTQTFGLIAVDRATLRRTPKQSLAYVGACARANAVL